jgi:hypothetical protein
MFYFCEREYKILGETAAISLYLLVQLFDRNPVKFGQVCVQNHFLIAQHQDFCADFPRQDYGGCFHNSPVVFEVTICDLKAKFGRQRMIATLNVELHKEP